LLRERRNVDILHFHWPQIHYQRRNRLITLLKFGRFMAFLLLATGLGRTVVWTAHNVDPHESNRMFDRWTRMLMARVASVVAHCQWAADEIQRRWKVRGEILVVPHGNYIGHYPDQVSRVEARRQLGLRTDARVFLHFGFLRGYKGLDTLLGSFQQLDGDHLCLLIAGPVRDESLGNTMREAVRKDPRVVFHPGFVPEDKVQIYFRAADMVVLPFTRVTTSGGLILSLSFGRGVIAPSIGCIPEVIDTSMGILYNPIEKGALLKALRLSLDIDPSAVGLKALEAAEKLRWRDVAEQHAEFYRRIYT